MTSSHLIYTGKPHICAFLGGFSSAAGNFGYLEMTSGAAQASVLAPMASCYLLIPVIVGIFFWKDRWSLQKLLGIAAAISAVILLALSPSTKFSIDNPANIGWFLMVFFTWGLTSCLYIPATNINSIVLAIMYLDLGYSGCTFIVTGAAYSKTVDFTWGRDELVMFFAGFLLTCGTNTYTVLVRTYREVSTISPLASLYVMIPVILGLSILGENITVYKIIGAVLSSIAILLLSTQDVRQLLFACLPKNTAKVHPVIDVRPASSISGINAPPRFLRINSAIPMRPSTGTSGISGISGIGPASVTSV